MISRGLASWIVSHGLKNVLLFWIMLSRFRFSAFSKRANVSLIGERVATYATVASRFGAAGKRNRIVTRVAWPQTQELRNVAAARRAVDADPRAVAVPGRRIVLEPAHRVVRVLHAGRIGRLGRNRHVDSDDEKAARCQRAVHRPLGQTILSVPGAAV